MSDYDLKLHYAKDSNFGDKLNVPIFNHYFGNSFSSNERSENILYGIGTILGLFPETDNNPTVRKIVFTSGCGYTSPPTIDDSYEIWCVRGPKTAKKLKLAAKKGLIDGAYLLKKSYPKSEENKVYKYSVLLHKSTYGIYDKWGDIFEELNIHEINVNDEWRFVIDEILKSEYIFAEAMHGAIVADAYRVRWIPIKSHASINAFKWEDFMGSIQLRYSPEILPTLYSFAKARKKIKNKIKFPFVDNILGLILALIYCLYRDLFLVSKCKRELRRIQEKANILSELSDERLVDEKINRLETMIDSIKRKYGK